MITSYDEAMVEISYKLGKLVYHNYMGGYLQPYEGISTADAATAISTIYEKSYREVADRLSSMVSDNFDAFVKGDLT